MGPYHQWALLAAACVLLLLLASTSDERMSDGTFARVGTPVVHRTFNANNRPTVSAIEWTSAGFVVKDADDEAARSLVASMGYGDVYDRLPNGAARADLYRYAAVFRHGGWYADQDVHPTLELAELAARRPLVFFHEACGSFLFNAIKRHLGLSTIMRTPQFKNALFAAPAGWPPLRATLDAVRNRLDAHTGDWSEADVINVSGPGVLTDVLVILNALGNNASLVPCARQPRYFRHEAVGSWRGAKIKNALDD